MARGNGGINGFDAAKEKVFLVFYQIENNSISVPGTMGVDICFIIKFRWPLLMMIVLSWDI